MCQLVLKETCWAGKLDSSVGKSMKTWVQSPSWCWTCNPRAGRWGAGRQLGLTQKPLYSHRKIWVWGLWGFFCFCLFCLLKRAPPREKFGISTFQQKHERVWTQQSRFLAICWSFASVWKSCQLVEAYRVPLQPALPLFLSSCYSNRLYDFFQPYWVILLEVSHDPEHGSHPSGM